jgi:hypothetical protein
MDVFIFKFCLLRLVFFRVMTHLKTIIGIKAQTVDIRSKDPYMSSLSRNCSEDFSFIFDLAG